MSGRNVRASTDAAGLRYASKPGGSPFGVPNTGPMQRSCFLCGVHKLPSDGKYRTMLGKKTFVCFGCRPQPAPAPAPAAQ